ncbi:MAG: hypothetical protein ACXVEE_15860 [Polyangiales bacterium]
MQAAFGNAQQNEDAEYLLDLERAHEAIHRAARALENIDDPPWDLRPAAESIERAIDRLYTAYDEREEPLRAAHDSDTEVAEAIDRLARFGSVGGLVGHAIEELGDARRALSEAERRLSYRLLREPPAPPPLRASKDVPTLHVVPRRSLPARVRVAPPPEAAPDLPPPLPEPKTLKELAAMVEEVKRRAEAQQKAQAASMQRAFAPAKAPAEAALPHAPFASDVPNKLTPLSFLSQRARDLLDEIAMLGMQRMPLLGDPFRSVQFLERRMLCALDAVAALGPAALASIEDRVLDSPVKDPSRAFSAAFAFGCMEGRDALGAATRIARSFGVEKEPVADAFADGLRLGTNTRITTVARVWLDDPEDAMRGVAIDVLAYRREATSQQLARAVSDASPRVVRKALPYLAVMFPRDAALSDAIAAALSAEDPALREAAWAAMTLSGDLQAEYAIERALETEERAAIPLAIVASSNSARRLLERAKAKPTELLLLALGWAGLGEAIPFLISVVGGKKKELRIAAANALDRITGARLYEAMELPPEKTEVEEPPEPSIDLGGPKLPSLSRQVSDPRDLPGEGAPDVLELPTTDLATWQYFWRERKDSFRAGTRYRRGHPYTPLVSWWELDQWRVTPFERRMLQRELVARTGQWVPFDPFDWVPVQEEAIRAWESLARSSSGNPGAWDRAARR